MRERKRKEGRVITPPSPEEIRRQVEALRRALAHMGYPLVKQRGDVEEESEQAAKKQPVDKPRSM